VSDEEFYALHPAEQLAIQLENLEKMFPLMQETRQLYLNGHQMKTTIKALRFYAEAKPVAD
jgi:hypothetical protein